jgi:hypothetical protein
VIRFAILLALPATSIKLLAQVPYKVFCVHVAGNKLGTLARDLRQDGLSVSVYRYHLNQLYDAFSRVPCVARSSLSRLEFGRPLADQLTMQRPPLLTG